MEPPTTGETAAEARAFQEPLGILLVGAGHVVASLIRPAFDAGHLKPRHVQLLELLARAESTSQQQLIEAMAVDPSVLVGLLNELEAAGIIKRIRDPRDRRRHLVEMSPSGRVAYADVLAKIEEAGRLAFGSLSDRERDTLRHALENIRATRAAPGAGSAC